MKHNGTNKKNGYSGYSRRDLLKGTAGWILLAGAGALVRSVHAEEVTPEPEALDMPTAWKEGDPEPFEMEVPAEEPEQTSPEAPPSQPMDDDRPVQPGPEYVWAYGYWWWNGREYVWVPGYWEMPPDPEYVYISGYWTYRGHRWMYVRGGWGRPNTTVVVVYPRRRRIVRVRVVRAPGRIGRRHRHWRHHHARRHRHRAPARRSPASPGRGPARPAAPRRTAPRRR